MNKKKIALFYDSDTEDGKAILDFLSPFEKRKSDIVGNLILLWIKEHGTNVPVQWMKRKCSMNTPIYFPVHEETKNSEKLQKQEEIVLQATDKPEAENADLIKAGLAAFM